MPCYHPLTGYRSKDLNPSGKRSIVFNPGPSASFSGIPQKLPCGQCIGCRLERSRQWAIRCVHEAQLHEHNSFLTLTYSDEKLPPDGSLQVADFQKFMKRLRKHFTGKKVRYFHCGEYGEKYGRPHYHACLFGLDFDDKSVWKEHNGQRYYVSKTLADLWPHGHSTIGAVTFESAAYVARYITKKVTGDRAEKFYEGRKPEYVTMSRRPGIAATWFEKFKSDVFPRDEVVVRGKRMPPPRFYLQKLSAAELEAVKLRRHQNAADGMSADNSHVRLVIREEVHELKAEQLKRSYEHEV